MDNSEQPSCKSALVVERIRVRPDRIETHIRVTHEAYAYTNPKLIRQVLQKFPSLSMHACRNTKGLLFADVMNDTSVPHLLEHMIVDRQTRCSRDDRLIFTGTTQWSREDDLVALVSFSYEDDLIALGALNECVTFLNALLAETSTER